MYDKLFEIAVVGIGALGAAALTWYLDKKLRDETGMGICDNLTEWYGGISSKVRAWIAENPNQPIRRILGKLVAVSDNLASRIKRIDIYGETKQGPVQIITTAMDLSSYNQMREKDREQLNNGEVVDLTKYIPIMQGA